MPWCFLVKHLIPCVCGFYLLQQLIFLEQLLETENKRKKIMGELTRIFRKQGSALWHLPETAGRYQFTKFGLWYRLHSLESIWVHVSHWSVGGRILEVLLNCACSSPRAPVLGSHTKLRAAAEPLNRAQPGLRCPARPPFLQRAQRQGLTEQRLHQRVRALTTMTQSPLN